MSQQTRTPGTINSVGEAAFVDLANAEASDDAYASALFGGGDTNCTLEMLDYGFSLPADATLLGLEYTVEGRQSGGVQDENVNLIENAAGSSEDKAGDEGTWTGSDTTKVYGGPTDPWAMTLLGVHLNDAGFGVHHQWSGGGGDTMFVDVIGELTAYYTVYQALAGTVAAVSTCVGYFTTLKKMEGTVDAVSAASGTMNWNSALSGTVAAQSGGTAARLSVSPYCIDGTVAAVSTAAGHATRIVSLIGTVAAVSTVADSGPGLELPERLLGEVAAQSTVNGTLGRDMPLAGTVAAVSTVGPSDLLYGRFVSLESNRYYAYNDHVDASAEDGYWTEGGATFDVAGSTLNLNSTGSGTHAFVTFDGVAVPQGQTISGANLQLKLVGGNTDTVDIVIKAVDADDPAAPTSVASADGMALTTAETIESRAFGMDPEILNYDVTSLIQELVDRAGWVGTKIVFFIKATDAGTGTLQFASLDSGLGMPNLFFKWDEEEDTGVNVLSVVHDTPLWTPTFVELEASLSSPPTDGVAAQSFSEASLSVDGPGMNMETDRIDMISVVGPSILSVELGTSQGSVAAVCTPVGALSIDRKLAGTSAAASTSTALLSRYVELQGEIAAVVSITANLLQEPALRGTVTAASTMAGILAADKELVGTVNAQTTAVGFLKSTDTLQTVTGFTATVSGHMHADRELVGALAATTTAAGLLSRYTPMSGAVAATSSATAHLRVDRQVAGNVSAASNATAELDRASGLEGAVACTTSAAADARRERGLSAAVAAVADVTGLLRREPPFVGTVTAQSAAAAALHVDRLLVGTVAVQSAAPAILRATKLMSETVSAQSAATGNFQRPLRLAGTCTAAASTAGILREDVELSGAITCQTTSGGTLGNDRALTGTVASTTTSTGRLNSTWGLQGAIASSTGASAILRKNVDLVGTVSALSSVSGSVLKHAGFSGTCASTTSTAASLSRDRAFAASIFVTSAAVQGLVRRDVEHAGSSAAVSGAAGSLTRYVSLY